MCMYVPYKFVNMIQLTPINLQQLPHIQGLQLWQSCATGITVVIQLWLCSFVAMRLLPPWQRRLCFW